MIDCMEDPAQSIQAPAAAHGQRGPAEHERRLQILKSAAEHFRHYGYRKTTVGDLAQEIGVTAPYIYRFFNSKQAIGEAVCSMGLGEISAELDAIPATTKSPFECIRKLYRTLVLLSTKTFFEDRKIHELVIASFEDKWASLEVFDDALQETIRKILVKGREMGEFDQKTPLDETCEAILGTLQPFYHPVLLLRSSKDLVAQAEFVANLVNRSLAR